MDETGELPTTATEKPKLPGGPAVVKPFPGVNGTFYDPYDPPKLYQNADGSKEYRGGTPIDKDTAYSMMFWAGDRPPGLKETMQANIRSATETGFFSTASQGIQDEDGKFNLDQASKEQLSAYRVLAKEMGYQIGGFKYDENEGTVQAPIGRIETEQK